MVVQLPHDPQTTDTDPGIDGGVIQDARARQRRHRQAGAVLATAALIGGALLGFGGGAGSSRPAGGGSTPQRRPVVGSGSSSGPVVLLRDLLNPEAYAARGQLWVTEQTSRPGGAVLSEIMRVDPTTGKVLAVRRLGAAYDQALLADGVLWVTTSDGPRVSLWRLTPNALRVVSRCQLPGPVTARAWDNALGSMATAGGWLWVAGFDTLERVSLTTAQPGPVITVPGAQAIDLDSNASGTVLVDSEGHGGLAQVQRRNPRTGALLAQSPTYEGVTEPHLGGVTADGVWLSEATGMMGYTERISLRTLGPTLRMKSALTGIHVSQIEGTNGITARVLQNILWITDSPGGKQRNYCANPTSGRPLASLPITKSGTYHLLTVGNNSIYYVTDITERVRLLRAAINPKC